MVLILYKKGGFSESSRCRLYFPSLYEEGVPINKFCQFLCFLLAITADHLARLSHSRAMILYILGIYSSSHVAYVYVGSPLSLCTVNIGVSSCLHW